MSHLSANNRDDTHVEVVLLAASCPATSSGKTSSMPCSCWMTTFSFPIRSFGRALLTVILVISLNLMNEHVSQWNREQLRRTHKASPSRGLLVDMVGGGQEGMSA